MDHGGATVKPPRIFGNRVEPPRVLEARGQHNAKTATPTAAKPDAATPTAGTASSRRASSSPEGQHSAKTATVAVADAASLRSMPFSSNVVVDLASFVDVATWKGHSSYVRSVAVFPSGDRVVSGSFDNTLKLWGPPDS